jgi:hypothetical protein
MNVDKYQVTELMAEAIYNIIKPPWAPDWLGLGYTEKDNLTQATEMILGGIVAAVAAKLLEP